MKATSRGNPAVMPDEIILLMIRHKFTPVMLSFLLAAACSLRAAGPGLPRSSPEAQGVSSAQVRAFVEAADEQINTMHSFMLVRHGHVVAEGWWKPEAADKPHVLWSLSKSFTSTAVGLAVSDDKLSIADPVLKFFPEDAPAEPSDNLKAMLVRDLLTMSAGHAKETQFNSREPWVRSFLAHPVPSKPGTRFLYNTPASYMLSAIVQKVTGETVLDYLRPRLFEPLGIEDPEWASSPQGVTLGGWGLKVRTEDLAKFGQLYLQKGEWNGRQLLPASWIEQATARQVANGTDPASDWQQGYGFQFWRCRHDAFRGDGKDGQFCIVLPEQDAVVALTADTKDMQAELNVVWDKLLPAFHKSALPEDAQAQSELSQTLAKLSVRPSHVDTRTKLGFIADDDPVARSLVSAGNFARLQHAFARARRGEPITVGVIGGSITQGARASKPESRYGNLMADWWRRTFAGCKVTFVNAGIGATGSNYGALRAKRDLLSHHPDFVVVEYAVNDAGDPTGHAESLEGLVRQILSQSNQPAVVLLFTMDKRGHSVQDWHAKVGQHYQLPMASLRDALWPEIKAGRMQWTDIEADDVHPNDRGHDYLARFVTRILETALRDGAKTPPSIAPLPQPLFGDRFEHVSLFEGSDLKPVNNRGWTYDAKVNAFTTDQPGSVIEFDVDGTAVLVTDWHVRGPFGKAKMQVDDAPPVIRDGWFDQTWGGYRDTSLLARGLKPGKHRVRIEVLEDKNPQSDGHQFRLLSLGAAGVARQEK